MASSLLHSRLNLTPEDGVGGARTTKTCQETSTSPWSYNARTPLCVILVGSMVVFEGGLSGSLCFCFCFCRLRSALCRHEFHPEMETRLWPPDKGPTCHPFRSLPPRRAWEGQSLILFYTTKDETLPPLPLPSPPLILILLLLALLITHIPLFFSISFISPS